MDTTHVIQIAQQAKVEWWMPIVQLAMFSIFIHSIIEVFKGFSAVGLWGIVRELFGSLWTQSKIQEDTIHALVFVLALVFCKVFEYGVMTDMLGIVKESRVVDWLDYIGTSSVVYVGVDVVYAQMQKVRTAITGTVKTDTVSQVTTVETKEEKKP